MFGEQVRWNQRWIVILAAAWLAAAGCRKPAPPAPAAKVPARVPAATRAAPAKAKASKPTTVTAGKATEQGADNGGGEPDDNSPLADKPTQASTAAATGADQTEPPPSAAASSPAPPAGVERFILFTSRSPLIVEVELRIGGASHSEALAALVEDVVKTGDTDGDGRSTWKELTESKRFIYGQFGNLAINDDNAKKQVVDMYDVNKNGVVDRGEVPRFVTRNAGGARAFSVRGTADIREIGALETPLWQLLQSDDDRSSLTSEELAAITGRLRSRDMDDDDVLRPGDFAENAALMPGQMPTSRRRVGPVAVRLLGDHAQWDMIFVNLSEQYALGARLSPDSFPLLPNLFEQLDADGDGRLSRKEYPQLDEVPAHIRLAAQFDPPAAEEGAADSAAREAAAPAEANAQLPKLRLVELCPELEALKRGVIEQQGRLLVQLENLSLMLYAADQVGGADYEVRAKQLLESLDADKNLYLEATEVPEQAQAQLARFEAVDTDEDGKIYTGEIISFLSQQQAALRAQVHAKAGDRDDPLFAALDGNGDDRLDGREIEGAADRLKELDRDGDGAIGIDEIPSAMYVGLARGSLENPDSLFVPPTIASRAPTGNAPRWFTSMDTSRDGLISQREFLGTAEQFGELDGNQDGFVDGGEAAPAKTAPAQSADGADSTLTSEDEP